MTPPIFEVEAEVASVARAVTLEDMILFEPEGEKNIQTDDEVARTAGLPAAIAAGVQFMSYVFEMLHREYGFQSVQGTVLDLRIREPVFAGDTVTARGRAAEVQTDSPRSRVSLEVWCENQRGGHVSDWKDAFGKKLISAAEAVSVFASGMTAVCSLTEPSGLCVALGQREDVENVGHLGDARRSGGPLLESARRALAVFTDGASRPHLGRAAPGAGLGDTTRPGTRRAPPPAQAIRWGSS